MAGYSKAIFELDPDPKFICTYCHLILNDPVQTSCGHRFCRSCMNQMLSENERNTCMACAEEGYGDEEVISRDQMYPDRAIQREMNTLHVHCNNERCDWKGKFKNYKDHVQVCDFEVLVCIKRGCNENILRGNMAEHLETQCAMRVVQCQYCQNDIALKELKDHQQVCEYVVIACTTRGCDENILRGNLAHHLETQCGMRVVQCQYCLEDTTWKKLINHLSKCPKSLVICALCGNKIKREEWKNSPCKYENQSHLDKDDLVEAFLEQKKIIACLKAEVQCYQGNVDELIMKIESYREMLQFLETKIREDREMFRVLEMKVRAQQHLITMKDEALAEQDMRITTLELVSYDGILLWPIKNLKEKQSNAQSGMAPYIQSHCFYTSRRGYKMCARIYLNGDGRGKGSHVSLFFVIMKGPFDGLLTWPFQQKVKFMLLNQNTQEHVVDEFRPDPTSSSFKMPVNNMNVASGCPLFMPISQLDSTQHAYVKNDVMYVKIIVDTSDIA